MKRTLAGILMLLMLVALVSCVTARGYTSGGGDIPDRIANQQDRINAGFADGSLSRSEADMLQDNLDWIRREYSRARVDGVITRGEYDRISRHLDQNSDMIYNKRHNPIRRIY